MELHVTNPDLEPRIAQWASETGRPADELVEEALAGYLSELAEVREMLESRYDDIVSGKVELVDGEKAFAYLRERIESKRNRSA